MKPLVNLLVFAGSAMFLTSCATRQVSPSEGGPAYWHSSGPSAQVSSSAPAASTQSSETPWPRTVVNGSTTLTIYEPQVDSWDGHQLTARNAVGIQKAGQSEPTYGVVTVHALTLVDKGNRNVSLENIRLSGGDFPSARESGQDYMKIVREDFPKTLNGLSEDRLQISLVVAPEQLKGSAQPLNNTPPKIIFSTTPAILVYVDGPPTYRPVTGTDLQRIINTRLLLLKDKDGQYYLHLWDGYLKSANLDGPWTVATKAPEGAVEAEKQALTSPTPADLFNAQSESSTNAPPSLTKDSPPKIYLETKPAELIIFDGEPNFTPIQDGHLLYVVNTTANVFRLLSDQQTYVLISGRWYRAPSLDGHWQFVPANQLASDFANIPDNSPKENVKASIPGTQQATEALLANAIPESTAVPRSTQMQNPQIDGTPDLRPVGGTPLYYVANSGTPIIKVDERSWYACENGVWFGATSINGPWTPADSVPAVIYTIPPSSPLHYLTYVRVYGSTPEEVYTGYTPGYWGTEVEDGVVVYGTGYYYSPWVGAVWYGYPLSWGFGWGPCWTPWYDWCFDFGFGWGCGWGGHGWWHCHPPFPWWGPHHFEHFGHHGGLVAWRGGFSASTSRSLYARSSVRTAQFARTESRDGFARSYNSRTGTMAAGQLAGIQNVFDRPQSHFATSTPNRSPGARSGYTGNWHGAGSVNHRPYGSSFSTRDYPAGLRGSSRGVGGYSHGGWTGGGARSAGGGRSGGESHGGGGGGGHTGGGGGGHTGGGGGGGRGGQH